MWRARERLQIDRPCDSIHAWVPSDRGESLCPVAKKPISENGESDQALASIASENFGLDRIPSKPNLGVHGAGRTAPARSSRRSPAHSWRLSGQPPDPCLSLVGKKKASHLLETE